MMRHFKKSQHKIWKNNISKISILTAVVISSFFRSLTPNYFFFIKSIDQSKLLKSCLPLRSQRGKNPTFPSLCFHRFEHLFGFNLFFKICTLVNPWAIKMHNGNGFIVKLVTTKLQTSKLQT